MKVTSLDALFPVWGFVVGQWLRLEMDGWMGVGQKKLYQYGSVNGLPKTKTCVTLAV